MMSALKVLNDSFVLQAEPSKEMMGALKVLNVSFVL